MEPLNTSVLWVPEGLELSASPLFNNDVAILTIIDVALAMALVILIAVYIKRRMELAQFQREPPPSFSDILESVKRMVPEGMLRQAILTEFPKILSVVIKIDGANLDASFTAHEAISHGLTKIPQEVKEALMTLYHIYEPVRFGNMSPSPEEGLRFLEVLRRLDGILAGSEAMNA